MKDRESQQETSMIYMHGKYNPAIQTIDVLILVIFFEINREFSAVFLTVPYMISLFLC